MDSYAVHVLIKKKKKILGKLSLCTEARARFFKLLRSLGNDSKESSPPAYVACLAGTITLFLLGS